MKYEAGKAGASKAEVRSAVKSVGNSRKTVEDKLGKKRRRRPGVRLTLSAPGARRGLPGVGQPSRVAVRPGRRKLRLQCCYAGWIDAVGSVHPGAGYLHLLLLVSTSLEEPPSRCPGGCASCAGGRSRASTRRPGSRLERPRRTYRTHKRIEVTAEHGKADRQDLAVRQWRL